MSELPPPNPYGAPPPLPPPPSRGPSHRKQIWIGIALALPAVVLGSMIGAGLGSLGDPIAGSLGSLFGLGTLVLPFLLMAFPRVRWIGVGILIGYAVLLVVAAGACVALLASYNGGG